MLGRIKVKQLPDAMKCAMYADDLVLWCREEHATTAQLRLQEAANILSNWMQDKIIHHTIYIVNKSQTYKNYARRCGITTYRQYHISRSNL